MRILITGGVKNGKTSLAQDFCCTLDSQNNRVYFATMIPSDSEDSQRISKHVEDRKNLNFHTVECGSDILKARHLFPADSNILFDSITSVLSNEMFSRNDNDGFDVNHCVYKKTSSDIIELSSACSNFVAVSDGIFYDSLIYDELTEEYRYGLAYCEKELAKFFDVVVEMVCGIPVLRKGSINFFQDNTFDKENEMFRELIIGGAYQGKLSYLKEKYNVSEEKIFFCNGNEDIDFSYEFYYGIENYILYCVKNNVLPRMKFPENSVIICTDIFCGVVPMDFTNRIWRERTGRYMQEVSKKSVSVTRIIAGLEEKLK